MPDQTQLVDELRRRIAYPTVHLPRELDHAGNPAETEERWAARAVAAGLEDGTLGYVPAGQQLHRADFDHLAAERDRWKNHSTQVQFETDRLTVQLAAIRDLAKRWTSRPNTPEHDCGVDILKTLGRFDGGTASVPGSSRRAQEPDPVAPPPGWAYTAAVWHLQQHIARIRARYVTLLPRDIGEHLLACSAKVDEEQAKLTPAGIAGSSRRAQETDRCGPDCSEGHTYMAGCAIKPPARAFLGEKPCGRPGCPCGS